MAADFPTTVPSAGSAVTTDTLADAGHTALHNDNRDNIRAIAQKLGTGAATPVINTFLTSTANDTSTWSKSVPTGDVVGTTDSQTLTNKTLTSPTINSPTGIVKGDVGLGNVDNTSDATKNSASATLTNKTIDADSNTISNISNAELDTTAGEPGGAWTSWTPTLTGMNEDTGTIVAKYVQIGKTVHFRFSIDFQGTPTTSGAQLITLPVTPNSEYNGGNITHHAIGTCMARDTTAADEWAGGLQWANAGGDGAQFIWPDHEGSTGDSETFPFTVAASDMVTGTGTYEAA